MKYRLTKTLLCLAMSCTAGIGCHESYSVSDAGSKDTTVLKCHQHIGEHQSHEYHSFYHHENSHHNQNHH